MTLNQRTHLPIQYGIWEDHAPDMRCKENKHPKELSVPSMTKKNVVPSSLPHIGESKLRITAGIVGMNAFE